MGFFLLLANHSEECTPVYFPGKQGITHITESRFLVSGTSQFNGLRAAGEYHQGTKGRESVWS